MDVKTLHKGSRIGVIGTSDACTVINVFRNIRVSFPQVRPFAVVKWDDDGSRAIIQLAALESGRYHLIR